MDALQNKRIWLGGGALAAVVIAAAGWFALISPELSSTSSLHQQTSAAELQNSVLQVKMAKLKKQNDNLPEMIGTLRAALAALPLDSGLPDFTRQLSAQAGAAHVKLSGISVATISPALGAAAAPAEPRAPATAAGKLYAVPITLMATGSAQHDLAFLDAIQRVGPRRALVTSTQFAPAPGVQAASIDGAATMTVQLTIFAAPRTPQAAAQLAKQLSGQTAG